MIGVFASCNASGRSPSRLTISTRWGPGGGSVAGGEGVREGVGREGDREIAVGVAKGRVGDGDRIGGLATSVGEGAVVGPIPQPMTANNSRRKARPCQDKLSQLIFFTTAAQGDK